MPIIDVVGRKKLSIKIFIAALYLILVVGGVTMVYPFILMVSNSLTSDVDANRLSMIPRFLHDDEVLFQKYLYERYSGGLTPRRNTPALDEVYGTDYLKWTEILFPAVDLRDEGVALRIKDWQEFREGLSEKYKYVGFLPRDGAMGKLARLYRQAVEERFGGNLRELNEVYVEEYERFMEVRAPEERYLLRAWQPKETVKRQEWNEFKERLPEEYKIIVSGDGLWQTWLAVKYEGKVDALNEKHGTDYGSFAEIHLASTLPDKMDLQADWVEFVKSRWPLRYLKVTGGEEEYPTFLRKKYGGRIKLLNEVYNASYASFSDIPLPRPGERTAEGSLVSVGMALPDWDEFVRKKVSAKQMEVRSTETLYREFLATKYGHVDSLNTSYGTAYANWLGVSPPYMESDLTDFMKSKGAWKKYFLTINYITVIEFIVLHGWAIWNTLIFCGGMVLATLTVNPMCAFALSRFNLKSTNKILLFLLATMAFPAEVAMIPNFLLLKELHLLNTYWALILPGMASGFSIFLLKGFFDSLPKELYEAATLDGASELRIFWQVTMPLSKPVLAYLALGAFTSAYGAFMFALIVCQDPDKWTLMVWLYEMHSWAPASVQMAAFVLATIPTLLVFIFAQNIIMRGIILPVER